MRRCALGRCSSGCPDGEHFRSRGYVELAGRFNSRNFGGAIGIGDGLVKDPDLACETKTAATLLAAYLPDRQCVIKEAFLEDDLRLARRLVNGASRGPDRFAGAYRIGEPLIA